MGVHETEFDYGCDAIRADFPRKGSDILPLASEPAIHVLKPHGSANWLYCDACRRLFWFPATKTDRVAQQIFKASDWEVVSKVIGKKYGHNPISRVCPTCSAEALGTRFATFSYRKALDFPMHASTWRMAEKLLQEAKNWIFIGYSLPAADYEFKLLLKRVQLSRSQAPKLTLITGGDKGAVKRTQLSYQQFFGPGLKAASPNV